jgi:hypothetical protein
MFLDIQVMVDVKNWHTHTNTEKLLKFVRSTVSHLFYSNTKFHQNPFCTFKHETFMQMDRHYMHFVQTMHNKMEFF